MDRVEDMASSLVRSVEFGFTDQELCCWGSLVRRDVLFADQEKSSIITGCSLAGSYWGC